MTTQTISNPAQLISHLYLENRALDLPENISRMCAEIEVSIHCFNHIPTTEETAILGVVRRARSNYKSSAVGR